ncbi:MAG: insulinase family protein [Oscillospiraceae bacterium]|nr:insulinase family protein [Oscillospiraceae bacterium]
MTETIVSRQTGEKCLHVTHKTGLEIYIMEMEGYRSSFALFGTKYGSINTRFRLRGEEDYAEVPEGIAHYLEHKLFENEDCDAFAKYARTGASANAYTSFDRTAYLFGCTENFNASLEILLDFVQDPYFTEENVEKERGIIDQEIRMNDDEPGWQVFFNMLKAMYHVHPVRIDIAGSTDSIQEITPELLYRCYNTFYNLHNMVLSVAGNVKADEVLAICDRLLKPCEDMGLEEYFPEEPDTVVQPYVEANMQVGAPLFNLGFKLRPMEGKELLRAELMSSILLEAILGPSTKLYNNMLEEGLINSEFDADSPFAGSGYFCLTCGGESQQPEVVRDRIIAELRRVQAEGFDPEVFERIKRVHYGNMIRGLSNVETNASNMLNAFMSKVGPFDCIDILAEITYEDAIRFLREALDTDKAVLSVVRSQEV